LSLIIKAAKEAILLFSLHQLAWSVLLSWASLPCTTIIQKHAGILYLNQHLLTSCN